MESHPDDIDILMVGAKALGVFATPKDLSHALDTIGRSRMEEQTIANMFITGQVKHSQLLLRCGASSGGGGVGEVCVWRVCGGCNLCHITNLGAKVGVWSGGW